MTRRLAAAAYVAGVGAAAGWGFVTDAPALIIAAAVATVPASLFAVPAYYMAYGLLAQVPGANPSSSSGSGSCTASGACHSTSTGDPAAWFMATTETLGVLTLVVAAACNLLALHVLLRLRRS